MKHIRTWRWVLADLTIFVVWNGCSQNPVPDDNDDNPSGLFVPDPEVYSAPVDAARLVEWATSGGRTVEFPVNQLILLTNEGVQRGAVDRLAAELGGTVVGQVLDIGCVPASGAQPLHGRTRCAY